MQGNQIAYAFHVPGTLAADVNIRFTLPNRMALQHVSAVGSNANDAELSIGTSADPDGWLEAAVIGDSNVPVEFEVADFDGALLTYPGAEPPAAADGTIVVLTLDHDGDGGTAADDVTIVLTFTE